MQPEAEDMFVSNNNTAKGTEVSKSLKRNYNLESDNRAKLKSTVFVNPDSKRRRTDELSGSPLETRIRQSGANKDISAKRLIYPQQQSQCTQNLMKTAIMHQIKNPNEPFVEGVKFSNEKLRFGNELQSSSSIPANGNSTGTFSKSSSSASQQSSSAMRVSHSAVTKNNCPQIPPISFGSGDHIALPEIYSESEDDDDDSIILDWANSPELRQVLRDQQRIDPDTVFGPIAPLQMEEVFKNRATRFRPRSSSANWSNQDRLTPQEIEAYAAEMGYRRAASSSRTPKR